ncbi:MAG: 3-dehydroquinate synthase family protein [Planctomycetales bacterium]
MSESLSRACTDAAEPRVNVSLGERSYEIFIQTHRLHHIVESIDGWLVRAGIASARRSALVVTDQNVAELHASVVMHSLTEAGWICRLDGLPAGETTKSLETISGLYDQLVSMQADRQTCVIAVGGGVIGDAAGFAASTYNRGLPFIQVPTTLLAQVDSSVGGKVGINHPQGKNLIGAFHQPIGVFIDTATLTTLPERDYRSGLAEVVKYGVILDEEFFRYLEANVELVNQRDAQVLRVIITRSCRLKADVVEQDEFERTGLRAVLNYGHTFAHA